MTQKCSALQPASWFCGRAYRPALAESFLLSVHRRQLSVMRHTWSYILYRQRDILALHKNAYSVNYQHCSVVCITVLTRELGQYLNESWAGPTLYL